MQFATNCIGEHLRLTEIRVRLVIEHTGIFHCFQRQLQPGDLLAHLVMQVAGNAPALLLLGAHQQAQHLLALTLHPLPLADLMLEVGVERRELAVFSGRVAALAGAVDAGGSDPVQVTFAIGKVWKGTDQPTIDVLTPASSASCGFEFVQGEEYLVYASESEGRLQTNLCSRTALLAMAGDDLAVLGPGSTPSSADEAQTPTTLPAT